MCIGFHLEVPQTGQKATSTNIPETVCPENLSETGYKMRLFKFKEQSKYEKKELNISVEDVRSHIIGITETWANKDVSGINLD